MKGSLLKTILNKPRLKYLRKRRYPSAVVGSRFDVQHGAEKIVQINIVERPDLEAPLKRWALSHEDGLHVGIKIVPSMVARQYIFAGSVSCLEFQMCVGGARTSQIYAEKPLQLMLMSIKRGGIRSELTK